MERVSVLPRPVREVELVHGYTLEQLNHLSILAVRGQRWHHHSDFAERVEVAWSAIATHLYASEQPPQRGEVLRVGWAAISDHVGRYHRFYGRNTNDRYAGRTAAFERFWRSSATPTRGPEEVVVEYTALWQIWAHLRPVHRQVLSALAVHDDYGRAAEALGMRRKSFTSQVSRARQAFLALWHEGEQPSRPWGCDRRKGADSTDRHPRTYVLCIRRRRRAKRTEASGGMPPAPQKRTGQPKRELGITREELERRYQGGESIRALAASLGCSYAVLQRHMHAEGIQTRPCGNSLRAPRPRKPTGEAVP